MVDFPVEHSHPDGRVRESGLAAEELTAYC